MTVSVETRETTRGAETGPPSGVTARKAPAEPRLGPLPSPSLVDRLRASWSLEALVPGFDPRELRSRDWRSAGALTLTVHVLLLAAIVILGRLALAPFVDPPKKVVWVDPGGVSEITPAETKAPETGEAPGGGGNTDQTPVTVGQRPLQSQTPIPPPSVKPPVTAALPIPTMVPGPEIDIPPPTGPVGIPVAPPGPPSLGDGGGQGVGPGTGPGVGPGPGGTGRGPGGTDNPGGERPSGPVGTGSDPNGGGATAPTGTPDHGVRITRKARAVPTKAMVENGTFGSITLTVTIGADGSILNVVPVQTLENGGTKAAIDAVYRCKFEPAVRNGRYVTASTQIVLNVRAN